MPIVPIYRPEENQRISNFRSPALNKGDIQSPAKTSDFAVRMELAKAVREETVQKGNVSESFLDRFAVTHLDAQDKDSLVVHDYTALRRAAEKESVFAKKQSENEQLQQESTWIAQVGELSADAQALDAYLKIQIPAYALQMEKSGFSLEQAQSLAENLRIISIERNMLRSLSVGDWQAAQEVFQLQKDSLPENMQHHFSEKIRHAFTRFEAQRLWQQAKTQGLPQGRSAQEVALSLLKEPDENLKNDIQQEIVRLDQTEQRQTAAKQAAIFAQLSQADDVRSQQLLDTQTVLDEEEIHQARQAMQQIQGVASEQQQQWLVQHYFEKDSLTPQEAFHKGLCTARDYFCLQASYLRQKSGQDLSEGKWLCRGMSVWMERQGFDAKDTTRAIYTVLTGAADTEGRMGVWKKIKTLLTC